MVGTVVWKMEIEESSRVKGSTKVMYLVHGRTSRQSQLILIALMEYTVQECGVDSAALVKFFVDDGNMSAPHAVILIDFIFREGPKDGYHV